MSVELSAKPPMSGSCRADLPPPRQNEALTSPVNHPELAQICSEIRNAGDLFRAASKSAALVRSKKIFRTDAFFHLKQAAPLNLSEDVVRRTIETGLNNGIRNPKLQKRLEGKKNEHGNIPVEEVDDLLTPTIDILPGNLDVVVLQIHEALAKTNEEADTPVYQRGGELCTIGIRTASTVNGIHQQRGTPYIQVVGKDSFKVLISARTKLRKYSGRSKDFVRCDPPDDVVKGCLAYMDAWRVAHLSGIIGTPTLRPDGSILDQPGYDAATGLYFHPSGTNFYPIPQNPTKDDAAAALQRLIYPFAEFPFCDASSLAVGISSIFSALVRHCFPAAPLYCISAPVMRAGKSLFVVGVSQIVLGKPCASMVYTLDENESRKRILSILREGSGIVNFDNVSEPLQGDTLCSVITSEEFSDRVLGRSEKITVPTAVTWFATGNNLVIKGDLSTRVLLCRLDPGVEHPEERHFKLNFREYILKHRAELIRDALTILRAYQVAGRPNVGLTPYGGFEEWSSMIRAPLVWLGMADPLITRDKVLSDDPDRKLLSDLLTTWNDIFGATPLTTSEIIHEAQAKPILEEVLTPICMTRGGGLEPIRLGRWLSKMENRISNGFRLVKGMNTLKKVSSWRVEQVQ